MNYLREPVLTAQSGAGAGEDGLEAHVALHLFRFQLQLPVRTGT